MSLLQPLIEILLIAICINIGTLLMKIELSFKTIAGVVTKAFFVFSISRILYIILLYRAPISRIEDLTSLSFWSISDWIDTTSIPSWSLIPLQLINIFQLAFVLLMAYAFESIRSKGYKVWLGTIGSTYGLGLIILMVIMSFLTAI